MEQKDSKIMENSMKTKEPITANFLGYGLDWHTFKSNIVSENWLLEKIRQAAIPGVRGTITKTEIKYIGNHAFEKPKVAAFDGEKNCWERIIKLIDDEISFYQRLRADAKAKMEEACRMDTQDDKNGIDGRE